MAIERRHDLRHDNAVCKPLPEKHQLVGKRGAADERDTRIDHAREEIARLLDEFRRGTIGRYHDHGSDRNTALAQLVDGFVDVNGVTLVVEAQNRVLIAAEGTYGLRHAAEARVAVGVLLRKDRDLAWLQPLHLHQILDGGSGFFGIAGAIVEDVAIRRIAPEQAGTGECTEEDHFAIERIRQGDGGGGRADVADDGKHLVLVIEALHRLGGASRLVSVVRRDEFELSAIHATAGIRRVECSFDAQSHILAELFGCAAERRGNSEADFSVGYTADHNLRTRGVLTKWLSGRRKRQLLPA